MLAVFIGKNKTVITRFFCPVPGTDRVPADSSKKLLSGSHSNLPLQALNSNAITYEAEIW